MIITKLENFIGESILQASEELESLLTNLDDRISKVLLSLIGKDVKTNYNFLNLSDEAGKFTFTSDSQALRKLSKGVTEKEIFSTGSKSYVGRIVHSILEDNGIEHTMQEIEIFTNKFKAAVELERFRDRIKVVSGDDIAFWYSEDNYNEKTRKGMGQLGKSCMRSSRISNYFKIYTMNPDTVRMVIILDDAKKLSARALLWNYSNKFYLDRIYFTEDSEQELMKKWLEKYYLLRPIDKLSLSDDVVIENSENPDGTFNKYPYMDTFKFYNPQKKTLRVMDPSNRSGWIHVSDTGGGFEYLDRSWCENEQEWYPEEECVYSQHDDIYIHRDNAVYSEYYSDYLYRPDAVFSQAQDSWIKEGNSITFYTDLNQNGKDIVDIDEIASICFPKLIEVKKTYKIEWFSQKLLDSGETSRTIADDYYDLLVKYFSPDDVEIKSGGENRYTLSTHEYPYFLIVEKKIRRASFSYPSLEKFFWEKFKLMIKHHLQNYWFQTSLKRYWKEIKAKKNIQVEW
jgi:hypothetical protein